MPPPNRSLANTEPCHPQSKTFKDAEFKGKLQQLRQTDNYTNLYYLARTYLFLALVIGGTIWFYHQARAAGLSFWWNVPVTVVAIILVGAGQHQLTGLAHEASHSIFLKNRQLNEVVSDWLCMFPMFSTTYHYRLQHLAHHQFVNDPVRDPNLSQLQANGDWCHFPMARGDFFRTLLRQLWLPNLIGYLRAQAQHNTVHADQNPYCRRGWAPSRTPLRVCAAYVLSLIVLAVGLVCWGSLLLLAVLPAVAWLVVLTYLALLPARMFHQSRILPAIPMRVMAMMRVTFLTILVTGLAWLTLLVDRYTVVYYLLLWFLPLSTSFSFFMMVRQLVQHSNSDRGWLTNTRVFLVNRAIRSCIFPFGQDFHLPHHLFASVPHYRLRQLHEILLQYPEYQEQAVVVEGTVFPKNSTPPPPTIVAVLGPAYAPRVFHDAHIDDTVLEGVQLAPEGEPEGDRPCTNPRIVGT